MYQRALQNIGVNTDLMPVSAVKKENLEKAQSLLSELKGLLDENDKLRQQGL